MGQIENFFLELFFPRFCFGCQKEGSWLCGDCKSIIDVSQFHKKFRTEKLCDLYFAVEYGNSLVKNLVQKFKYKPFVKELSKPLCSLITDHFQLLEDLPPFCNRGSNFILIPIPLEKRKLRRRGFNQVEEITKQLSKFLELPLLNNVLIKKQATFPQVELFQKERKQNILGAFSCQNEENIKGKNILLVDDVYTTGSTMKEAAKTLKESGAKKVIGIVIARAIPGQDTI